MALMSLQKENSRDAQGASKDKALNGLPMIHATAAHLRSATRRIHTLQAPGQHTFQAPGPGHEDPGESELPSEW